MTSRNLENLEIASGINAELLVKLVKCLCYCLQSDLSNMKSQMLLTVATTMTQVDRMLVPRLLAPKLCSLKKYVLNLELLFFFDNSLGVVL